MSNEVPPEDASLVVKVNAALKKMGDDRRLKRTKKNLAKLLGVSRGTLYYHPWVITRFDEFRLEQRTNKDKPRPSETTHVFDHVKSDQQVLELWRKCKALAVENESLKTEVDDLRRKLGRNKGGEGDNVVHLPRGPK